MIGPFKRTLEKNEYLNVEEEAYKLSNLYAIEKILELKYTQA